MFKKIITYFLIIAVIAPILSAMPLRANKSFAQTTNSTYKNKSGYTVNVQKTTNSSGKTTVYEDYEDRNGNLNRRKKQYNSGEESTAKWKQTVGRNGDFSESASDSDSGKTDNTGSTSGGGDSTTGSGSDEENKTTTGNTKEVSNPCSMLSGMTWGDCINYTIANIFYGTIFRLSNYITMMAGSLFNASIGFSLTSESFPTDENSMIATGWTMTRDLINLFFIFILLYIAISTILQYGSFGKDVIVKLIIAAVLINFSLMITKVVIDSSHVLAWEFYKKIDVKNEKGAGDGEKLADIKNEVEIKGFKMKNLANVFLAGFNPQKLIIPSSDTDDTFGKVVNRVSSAGGGISATWFQIILIMVLASVLNILAAFILFAGAIFFVARIIVLWFVLILSPLAFAGMITPKFQKYSGQWWNKLISQSFFAPAFLFLFYLVTELINSGFLKSVISAANNSASAKVLFINPGSTIIIFFHFIIVGGLMVGCLWIAQQMGAYGASGMMSMGKKWGDWARNTIGDKAALTWSGRGIRRASGGLAEKIATSDSAWAKGLRYIPGVTRGTANIAQKNRARIDEIQKKYTNYNDKELQNMLGITTVGFNRAAIIQELTKRKSLKDVKDKEVEKTIETLQKYGTKTKDTERLRPELVSGKGILDTEVLAFRTSPENREHVQMLENTLIGQGLTGVNLSNALTEDIRKSVAQEKIIKKIPVSDIEATSNELFKDPLKHLAIKNFGSGHANKILDIGGEKENNFMKGLVGLNVRHPLPGVPGGGVLAPVNSSADIQKALEDLGNSSLAGWAGSLIGKNMIDAYGRKIVGAGWVI